MVRCNLASPKGKAMITLSLRGSVATAATLGRVAPLLSLRDIFPVSAGTFTPQ